MTLNLEEVRELVKSVAREQQVSVDVVGVTTAEGDGCYAGAIVNVRLAHGENRRVSVGVQRDGELDDLRVHIAGVLETAGRSVSAVSHGSSAVFGNLTHVSLFHTQLLVLQNEVP